MIDACGHLQTISPTFNLNCTHESRSLYDYRRPDPAKSEEQLRE